MEDNREQGDRVNRGELRGLMEDVPSFDEALSALEGLLESFEGADLD